jgi:hypothetical protein
MNQLIALFSLLIISSVGFAAPGEIAPPASLTVLKRATTPGADLVAEALANFHTYRTVQLELRYYNNQSRKTYQQRTSVTVAYEERQEPDAEVATNYIVIEGTVFEFGRMDIERITKVGPDLIKVSGSAGYFNNGGESCGYFTGAKREVVIKFSQSASGTNAKIVSQKDTPWCH